MIERFFVEGKTIYQVVFQEYPPVEKPWAVMKTVFGSHGGVHQRLEHVEFATAEDAYKWLPLANAWSAIPEAKK